MITPLRNRHRWMAPLFVLMGFGVWGAALVVKPDVSSAAAAAMAGAALPEGSVVIDHPSGRFRAAVTAAVPAGTASGVWLLPQEPLDIPDLLVYGLGVDAAAEASALVGENLPSGAVLLGPASPTAPTGWTLDQRPAALLLFSLAHQTVSAVISLPKE